MSQMIIALAGNPNVGKSTVFNALTGARQHVGNWPGKTVEKKEGLFKHNGLQMTVIDLPGTYSLSAYSIEEQIARDFIVEERPRLVVNVIDASNIERNLYLTAQLLETGIPLIVAVNMADQAESRGLKTNTARLSQLLQGVSVIPMVASKGQGIDTLKESITSFVAHHHEILTDGVLA
jgi:ferrous iron transport protein B